MGLALGGWRVLAGQTGTSVAENTTVLIAIRTRLFARLDLTGRCSISYVSLFWWYVLLYQNRAADPTDHQAAGATRSLTGCIRCRHRQSSGSQHQVFQQERFRQGEQGEACQPWSKHEDGQRSGEQDQAEQTDVAQPHPCKEEDGGTDFERSKDIDKRVKSQERKGCRQQTSDRIGINEFERTNPEQHQRQPEPH